MHHVRPYTYTYDAISRVTHDQRNGDADLATQYSYNVRSWLTDIQVGGNAVQGTLGETFSEKLYYNSLDLVLPQVPVQWGGNVSAMEWMAHSDGTIRMYGFSYDGLSRLTGAEFKINQLNSSEDFSRGYSYDLNGNITSLATPSDTTQVTYAGNQLTGGNNYSYDANGNLTKDSVRGIDAISYNLLNLPSSITLGQSLPGGPGLTLDGRNYLYTSSGVKLQSIALFPLPLPGHTDLRERIDYVGNLVYDRTSLKKVLIDGGYVDMSGNSPEYRFFITDHLGNNRVVTDTTGTILQTNHYDPYGESLPIGAAVDSGNPYKYGGKEYDDKALAYDFGARYFTTSIPRWTTMDPLAEKYYSISPYAYCAGNPMNLTDPDGRDGMVTGSGTEEDPFVITVVYYYQKDMDAQYVEGLQAAIDDYNSSTIKKNGKYIVFNLSSRASDDPQLDRQLNTGFLDISGNQRYYGNLVEVQQNDTPEYGTGSIFTITFNEPMIKSGIESGMSQSALIKGVAIHEIGHNLGAEHEDGTSVMQPVTTLVSVNQLSTNQNTTRYSYPSFSKRIVPFIFNRRDTERNGNARLWTKKF